MSPAFLFLLALGLGLAGWLAGRAKARAFTRVAQPRQVVARPGYHAWYVATWVAIPLAVFAVIWAALSPSLVDQWVLASPAAQNLPEFGFQRQSILAEARAVASGSSAAVFNPEAQGLIEPFREAQQFYSLVGLAFALAMAMILGIWAYSRLKPAFAARVRVERTVMAMLLLAAHATVTICHSRTTDLADIVQRGDIVVAALEMPSGTTVERTAEVTERIEAAADRAMARFADQDTPTDAAEADGTAGPSFLEAVYTTIGQARSTNGPGGPQTTLRPNLANVQLSLVPSAERDVSAVQIEEAWREELGEVAEARSLSISSSLLGVGAPINVQLNHPDDAVLDQAGDRLMAELGRLNLETYVK